MTAPRRLLLVSHHFGRHAATGGFRWAAMLPALREGGWAADVITATAHDEEETHHWRGLDTRVIHVPAIAWPDRLGEVLRRGLRGFLPRRGPVEGAAPPAASEEALRKAVDSLRIWRPGTPLGLRSSLTRTYDLTLLGAAHVLWSRQAVRAARRLLAEGARPAVVAVSSPPHWTQLAGRAIAREAGRPCLVDLRDPWVVGVPELEGFIPRPVAWIEGPAEALLQRHATIVVHNTEAAMDRALRHSPPLPRRARAFIPNGYDADPVGDGLDPEAFRILFSGWLYPFMDPRPLLAAASKLARRHDLSPDRFRIAFLGSPDRLDHVPLVDVFRRYGLQGHAEILPRVDREEALRMQARAAVLVAFDYPHPLSVVMKAYDYLPMPGTLLFLGNPESSLGTVARRVGADMVPPNDEEAILQVLEAALQRWKRGTPAGPHDPEGLYRRSHASRRTLDLLDALAASPSTAAPLPAPPLHSSVASPPVGRSGGGTGR